MASSSAGEDTMEDHQAPELYTTSDTPLILNPATISTSSVVMGGPNVIVTTTSEGASAATAGAITIGSQMYIIQSDPSQPDGVEAGLDPHHPHTFVLQSDISSQGEAVSLQSSGEEAAESAVVAMGEEADFTGSVETTAVVDTSQVDGSFHGLQGTEEEGVADVINSAGDQGETITISLEEATQMILQQQGLEGAAIQMADGSYQILGQQFIQVTKEDGTVDAHTLPVEVVQALSSGMVTYSNIQGAHESDMEVSPSSQQISAKPAETVHVEESKIIIKNEQEDKMHPEPTPSSQAGYLVQDLPPASQGPNLTVSVNASGSTTAVLQAPDNVLPLVGKPEPVEPKPDLNCPIEVTEHTEVMIKGKKCVLMQNPDTKQLCAYPILPPQGKKRRGRPRKVRPDRSDDGTKPAADSAETDAENTGGPGPGGSEDTEEGREAMQSGHDTSATYGDQNSAAEGLLELSNAGPDNVRRSARKRKKAKVFEDYDVLEASSDDDTNFNDDEKDPDVTMYGVKKQKMKREPLPPANPFMLPVKRGRGRPRRYPPPGQSNSHPSIPAVILPSANGQTLVMAPLQGLQNLPGLQSQVKTHLQQLIPKPPAVLASNGESTLHPLPPTTNATSTPTSAATSSVATTTTTITLGPDGDAMAIDASAVLEGSGILSSSIPGESLPLGEESADAQGLDSAGEKERGDGEAGNGVDSQQQTVIQIPDNLLTMFGIKKDPIKIGLKASESELEKLKCPKCDFQGYYLQQYQNHIATHAGDIHKCKCCNYLTFDKDDLLQHFKGNHPRCICDVCEFMAEHAYMIKRHMMRHNAEGCTCEVCGKTYKDQYILKMHVKMVHMPAEVLFECQVCGKKFTRKAHLKRHLRIHDPEKPFKCPHCDYRGCERSDISKHLLIHEEPRHVCEVCGKAFRHIKNKELHVKRHNGQRDYKCGVCDFYGYTFTDIRKHIERKHSDIKTVACDKCAMPFKSEIQLREHQKENCDVMMIEQALAIATSNGGTSQATIQIPSSFAVDGQQITIDGQHIAVDGGQVNITVEHVPEEDVSLDDQMVETTIADIVTSAGHVIDSAITQEVMSDGTIHIIPNNDIEEEEEEDEEEEEEEELPPEGISLEQTL